MKHILNDWIEKNIPLEIRGNEEYDNADMIMFANYYHKEQLRLYGVSDCKKALAATCKDRILHKDKKICSTKDRTCPFYCG